MDKTGVNIEYCSKCVGGNVRCDRKSKRGHVKNAAICFKHGTRLSEHGINTMTVSNRPVCSSRICVYILCLVICNLHICNGTLSYPAFFNVAKDKPISVDPEEATCGHNVNEVEYCDSQSGDGSINVCFPKTCIDYCPHTFQIESNNVLHPIEDYSEESSFGACVVKDTNIPRPAVVDYAIHFKAESTDSSCGLRLNDIFYINILLSAEWNVTYHFYIKHHMEDGQTGVIIDHANSSTSVPHFQIYLQGEQLKIRSGETVVTQPSWTVTRNVWTHVAVSLYEEFPTNNRAGIRFVTVYLNGQVAPPTDYGEVFLRRQHANRHSMGQAVAGGGTFQGYLVDFKMIMRVLSNREVAEVYSGSLPETRIQSECRCPAGYPMLKDNDPVFCTRNEGTTSNNEQQYRIQQNAHPVQFVNDDKIDSAWISDPQREDANIIIDLQQIYEVRHVVITFYSPLPSTVIIERQVNDGHAWQHWQLYSDACFQATGYQPEQALTYANDVTCKQIIPPNTVLTYSGSVLTFDLLVGRAEWMSGEGELIEDLRDFLLTQKIRVTMRGHPYVNDNRHKYHGVYEISVNGTCNCHGHAHACDMTSSPYECDCSDESQSDGQLCDSCVADTYQLVEQSAPYPAQCLACGCNTDGTVNADTTCDESSGHCPCKARVTGLQCDVCASGYYNLQASNNDGCTQCDCDLAGVLDASMPCDGATGQCFCKDRVVGDRCDRCEAGYYNLNAANEYGCLQCACHVAGTIGDPDSCDVTSGQCNCKTHAAGRACDACVAGYYSLSTNNPDGCTPCNCDFPGAQNTSCHVTSGQCYCKQNIDGATCNECMNQFYAVDFEINGCQFQCDCSVNGSRDQQCESRGGQCECKSNTQGRACDECKGNSYDFGASENFGCNACTCEGDGTMNGDLTCDVMSGQCNCKSEVESRQCDTCMPGYFGLSSTNEDGCNPCDCYQLGTVENGICDDVTGQCPCIDGAGDPELGGRQCSAYTDEVVPTFGPESGGTRVSIRGGYFGDPSQALVALLTPEAVNCPIDVNASSSHVIVCVTRPLNETDSSLKYVELDISTELQDGTELTPDTFMYMEDPQIESIHPLRSIVSGGITLTVNGEYLDSVAFPYLEVSMVYTPEGEDPDVQMFESLCAVHDGQAITCPTPSIEVPEEFQSAFNRRKRNADIDSNHAVRKKRQVVTDSLDYILNSDTLQFYIGFRLDGVMKYKNMSEIQPEYGILKVYFNPEFEAMKDEVTNYQPYWPFNDDQVDIKGSRLDFGAQQDDYTMRVGNTRCKDISLHTNHITCIPPATQPDKGPGRSKKGAPALTIEVGNIIFVAGYLKYEHTFWDNTVFRYSVLGGLIAIVIIIVIIIIICVVVRRRRQRKRKEKQNNKLPHLDQFDQWDKYPTDDNSRQKESVINAYGASNFHFPTLSTEKRPDPVPRPVHTLPPPSSREKQLNGIGSASSYLNPMQRPAVLEVLTPELKYRVEQVVMDDERLVLGRLIHEGKTGNIHLGQLTDRYQTGKTTVLVKRLTEPGMVPREMNHFLEDTCALRNTKHENVRKLVGIMIEDQCIMSVWPHAENGSLKAFITNDENMLTVGELIDFGQQVSIGMTKLAECKVVHKDLAARNCVVTKELIVKVADGALSRDTYTEDYWRGSGMKRSMPVRWMALESLEIDVFTSKADAWSFGILLWELLTRGCLPYPEVKNSSVKSFLMCGNRMDRPDFCPEEIYALMLNCWDESPRDRPAFPEASERISTFLDAQNMRTNLRNRGRQHVPSSRRRGHTNYAMLYQ